MTPTDPGTLILAILAAIGLIGAIVAWFFKRGGTETAMSIALDRNTSATDRLTEKLDGVVDTLHDHAIRLTRLETHQEAALNGNRAPAHRDAGPPG